MTLTSRMELFDEYARRQFVARAPHQNPFGTDETPSMFNEFDAFTKVCVCHKRWIEFARRYSYAHSYLHHVSIDPRSPTTCTVGDDLSYSYPRKDGGAAGCRPNLMGRHRDLSPH